MGIESLSVSSEAVNIKAVSTLAEKFKCHSDFLNMEFSCTVLSCLNVLTPA